MNRAKPIMADTYWTTLAVFSRALLGKICGLEGVHTASRILDGRSIIICALALQRLRHGGAMVVGGTCCGGYEGVWYAGGWVEGREKMRGWGLVCEELLRWEVQVTSCCERARGRQASLGGIARCEV